jgi:hypothetical protein
MPLHPASETLMLQEPVQGFFQPVTFSDFDGGRPQYLYTGRVYRRISD